MTTKEIVLSDDPVKLREQLSRLSRAELFSVREEAKAILSRDDFVMYCEYVHNWKLAPHQLEWAETLTNNKRACIVAPPESGKSRLTRAWVEWMIGRDQNIAIAIVQNTSTQASKQVSAIGEIIKNNINYNKVFPAIKPTDRWSGQALYIKRDLTESRAFRPDATVSGYGIDGNYQGAHVDILIIDDPTDQKDVLSPIVMQTQRELIKGVLSDRLRADGHLFVILTRWDDNDLVPTIEELEVPVRTYPAWRDDPYPWGSNLLFPGFDQYGTKELLDALEKRKGPDLFRLTYLCQSAGAVRGKRIFETLNAHRHIQDISKKNIVWVKHALGVDWGTTQQHQSAMVLASKAADGRVFIRACWMSPTGSSDEMFKKAKEWKLEFGFRNAWVDPQQSALVDSFKFQAGIAAFKGNRWVELRIGSLLTLLDTNAFYIDKDGTNVSTLWNQLTSYARDEGGKVIEKADDLVDACLYALSALEDAPRQGIGPDHEIRDPDDDTGDDPYHDNFKPEEWKPPSEFGGKMKDFSGLV